MPSDGRKVNNPPEGKRQEAKAAPNAPADKDKTTEKKHPGHPFHQCQAKTGNRAGQNHAQSSVLGFLGQQVPPDQRHVERHQRYGNQNEHHRGHGQVGDVFRGVETHQTQPARHVQARPFPKAKDQQNGRMGQQKNAEPDVGAFLGEHFPQLVA
jgi:hypothetical protein